jgi:glyceraldehyde-3-phosphate dehydrogenase (NADP+)
MATGIAARREHFVSRIVEEVGKPRKLAEVEIARAVLTFTTAAEEAKRFGGELVPVDIEPSGRDFLPALALLVARGPVLAITPFNFPLNLVAHKVAPALAVGAPVLVKPAPQGPGAAELLAEVFQEALQGLPEPVPPAALQVVSASNDVVARAIEDPRMVTLSFTGGQTAGWSLRARAGRKHVVLELGGNAAVIVHGDADLGHAASRCAFGAFAYAGQVCISVQRVFVERRVFAGFLDLLTDHTRRLGVGDPHDASTVVGPLIDAAAVERVRSWIDEAKMGGARVVLGGDAAGEYKGNVLSPTVLTGVPRDSRVACEEVFGPVVVVEPYDSFDEAIEAVNSSRYGLQAGVFTRDIGRQQLAMEELDVGGLLFNEVPMFRADHLPYGGVKESGLGREGIRYAMQAFSEVRTIISRRLT